MSEPEPTTRFLRHRRLDKVFETHGDGSFGCRPRDADALEEFLQVLDLEGIASETVLLQEFLLIDCEDNEPIAYSPPHRYGRFWIVPRLFVHDGDNEQVMYAPYPHAGRYRHHQVLRINRGKRVTTLERDDYPMVVIAPAIGRIAEHGGNSADEDSSICWTSTTT